MMYLVEMDPKSAMVAITDAEVARNAIFDTEAFEAFHHN